MVSLNPKPGSSLVSSRTRRVAGTTKHLESSITGLLLLVPTQRPRILVPQILPLINQSLQRSTNKKKGLIQHTTMNHDFENETRKPLLNPSSSSSGDNSDAASFECNICFELAQDPIVTLCGHLYCWPCLYKWLHHHSHSQECPVCKALIQEQNLVPLYGRGKTPTDPRSKSFPNIPNRPTGQRPETAPPPDNSFGFTGGFGPVATARFGNFTLSAALNGFFPSLFSLQVHGFPGTNVYGAAAAGRGGVQYGYHNAFNGAHAPGFQQPTASNVGQDQQQQDTNLPLLFMIVGGLVLFLLMFS